MGIERCPIFPDGYEYILYQIFGNGKVAHVVMSEVDERLSVVTKKLLESAFVAIANPTYPLYIVHLIRVQFTSTDLSSFVLADELPVADGLI